MFKVLLPGFLVLFSARCAASVDLSYFTALCTQGAVQLQWGTTCERNNALFIAERSTDAENWSEVQFINGAGYSRIAVQYETTDFTPGNGTRYYRLRSRELTGDTWLSDIISVMVVPGAPAPFSLYLSQSEGELQLELKHDIPVTLMLLDASGREVLQYRDLSERTLRLSIGQLARGMYHLRVHQGSSVWLTRFYKE